MRELTIIAVRRFVLRLVAMSFNASVKSQKMELHC
jgi:hypothetical protein